MKYLSTSLLFAISYASYANDLNQSCEITLDKLPSAPQPEIVVSHCIDTSECWLGLRMKNEHVGFVFDGIGIERQKAPKMFLELEVFPQDKDKGTRLSGELAFFDGLTIYSSYTNNNGCGIVSVQKIKPNKERNGMDATVVAPIR